MTNTAMVLGGASNVWLDVAALERELGREWRGLVVAANDVGVHWVRHLDAWTSLHPDKLMRADPKHQHKLSWLAQRKARGLNTPRTFARRMRFGTTDCTQDRFQGGSSGLLAIEVAMQMGATRIVLCGIPMTVTPHFAESIDHGPTKWRSADSHWRAWRRHDAILMQHVRSMSGRTRETYGAPTRAWLMGDDDG